MGVTRTVSLELVGLYPQWKLRYVSAARVPGLPDRQRLAESPGQYQTHRVLSGAPQECACVRVDHRWRHRRCTRDPSLRSRDMVGFRHTYER